MAANSDGHTELTTIVTCEGDLSDPRFPTRLEVIVGRLNDILGDKVKVHKLEPWNSVRVTLSIPREAALRLRQLANGGSQQLRALGILSVQVEGDQVISLRIASGSANSEPQEIVLRTAQDGGPSDRRETDLGLSNFLSPTASSAASSSNSQVQFKSPNVVCPSNSVVPKVGTSTVAPNTVSNSGKAFAGPFPFASMNQAIHSNRETPFNSLPPPYPGKHPPVTISSPLLVNLLQNDGAKESGNVPKMPPSVASARSIRTPPVSVHKTVSSTVTVSAPSNNPMLVKPNSTSTQANVLVNNSISPSALSTNTSIRQNSTILTSTTVAVNKTPPPQYHRALPASMAIKQQPPIGFPSTSTMTSAGPQINSLPQSSNLLPQNALPVPQLSNMTPSNLHQQSGVFQSHIQSKHTLTSSILPQQNSLLAQNSIQPGISLPHTKPPLSQQNISKIPLLQPNMALPQQKNFSISQPKNPVLNSVLPQTTGNVNLLSQLKSPLSQVASIPKHHNSFLTQSGNNPQSNFLQPSAPIVTSPQAGPSSQTTPTLPHLPSIPTSLSDPAETIVSPTNIFTQPQPTLNNLMSRHLPSPPPYSVAISRPWDTLAQSNSIMDLTPTLTDLKSDVLDELLPTLERELSHSPLPDLSEDLLSGHSSMILPPTMISPTEDKRKFLVNPMTGELEPQSGGESDAEELKDVFTGLPSPAALSDDDTSSTTRPDAVTDHSDSETRSSDTTKPPRLKNSKIRDRGRDSPALKQEKIKLRLKLEKSEPINPAYKVDVSFINTQPKKASASMMTAGEELRVPPLHISLRGRNSVVIKNKNKLNPDGTPMKPKVRKNQDHTKIKKNDGGTLAAMEELVGNTSVPVPVDLSVDQAKSKPTSLEQKKFKKFKPAHDHKDIVASLTQETDLKSKFVIHNHYKDKQKERRGSDSELVRNNNKKYVDSNGVICDEKKRRLSQAEQLDEEQPAILGSTNVGTIMGLPQKPRKDKMKVKDLFKKDASRIKIFNKGIGDKMQVKQVTLPTAGEMNMEAKFKQGLLEGTGEKGIIRPPHRTEVVNHLTVENNGIEASEKVVAKTTPDPAPLKDKSPEPDKCNTPESKSVDLAEKPNPVTGGRSPNSGTGQGEDSGIESMDALSEKSPNQASQSPHADILPPKTQVPSMLDIEAQLAKMEGLNGDTDRGGGEPTVAGPTEDVNENKCHHDQSAKLKQCCELTCALQDSLKQGTVTLSTALSSPTLPAKQQAEVSLVPLKVKKEEDLEPLPVRVTPALYTYSNPNPDKGRGRSESPALSDEDSNSCSTNSTVHNNKQNRSLLEQLLIEIPNDHQSVPSSPSPATRSSVRTRALSKLGSPELSSPVTKNTRAMPPAKRKRNESDSSNQSLDEARKKPRKASEPPSEAPKTRHNEPAKTNNAKKGVTKVQQEESSDSDEPLIEKLRKPAHAVNTQANNAVAKSKVKSGLGTAANNNKAIVMNTRRSVRSNMPAQNTRSKGDKVQSESEALRRKTRSTVSDLESKRKKEVK